MFRLFNVLINSVFKDIHFRVTFGPNMAKWYVLMWVLFSMFTPIRTDSKQIFLGGALNYYITDAPNGNVTATVELITGWILGQGPCGPNCSKADVGRSSLSTRATIEQNTPSCFGIFYTDYALRNDNNMALNRTLTGDFIENMTEIVLAVSESAQWEQTLTKFSFQLLPNTMHEDLNFEGDFWRNLTLQYTLGANNNIDWNIKWHLQAKIKINNRNDTKQRNNCPITLTRPFYRIKLNDISTITLPNIDIDGDFVKCYESKYVEVKQLGYAKVNGITVLQECQVVINASESLNHRDDTWIAIPITVRDYPPGVIKFGNDTYSSTLAMCSSAIQFVVQILKNLKGPVFVAPTEAANHEYHLFAEAAWKINVYAKASENTTIAEFVVTSRGMENISVSPVQNYVDTETRIRFAKIEWTPTSRDETRHIVCVTALDDTGVDSTEQRCFILNVKPRRFTEGSPASTSKPYFIELPNKDDFLSCPVDATCIISVFVKSMRPVTKIIVNGVGVDVISNIGDITKVFQKGDNVYKAELTFQHSSFGQSDICLNAVDDAGVTSDIVCLGAKFESEDPCYSTPCINYGNCLKRNDSSGLYDCICSNGYSGKNCEIDPSYCSPDPCVYGTCININPAYCYCGEDMKARENDYTGKRCDTKIDDCASSPCSNRSMCIDGERNFTCECFPRFDGTSCTNDRCPNSNSLTTCPETCTKLCHNGGFCKNGVCKCTLWYTGDECETNISELRHQHLNNRVGVHFVSPTPTTGTVLFCNLKNWRVHNCYFDVYIEFNSSLTPQVSIDSTALLKGGSSSSSLQKLYIFKGVDNMYTSTVHIVGNISNVRGQYICVVATDSVSQSKDEVCYKLQFVLLDHNSSTPGPTDTSKVQFVRPTLTTDTVFTCYLNERCRTVLATNNVGGGCETIVTAADDITVFPPVEDGQGTCFSEIDIPTASETSFTACFRSTYINYEERCYRYNVVNNTKDSCAGSGDAVHGYCQNNGKCFIKPPNDYECYCSGEKYSGKNCSKGPCLPENNDCSSHGVCLVDNNNTTCICEVGFADPKCHTDLSSKITDPDINGAGFLNFGKPVQVNCNKNRECETHTFVGGDCKDVECPNVGLGFVSDQLQVLSLTTSKQQSTDKLYLTSVTFLPTEIGDYDLCLQTLNKYSVNKDEVCFVVHVTAGVGLLYGISDLPHFINPSHPLNTTFECVADEICHVLYTAVPGEGNDKKCVDFEVMQPEDLNINMFTSCHQCVENTSPMSNCTIDLALRPKSQSNENGNEICILLRLNSGERGESRCFNVSTSATSQTDGNKGCQVLQCLNGGFCDGHVQDRTVCYCKMGFTGRSCETNLTNDQNGVCVNTFDKISGSVSTEIRCPESNCTYPFTVCHAKTAKLETGYVAAQLDINLRQPTDFNQNACICTTRVAELSSKSNGSYSFCLQIKDNAIGLVLDEICPKAHFSSSVASEQIVDKDKPYFLVPTLPADSVVLCGQNETCHLNVYYTDGPTLGVTQQCPTLKDSSPTKLVGLHMFPSQHTSTQCSSNVAYKPVSAISSGEVRTLCLKVSIPGKQGEERCFRLKIIDNVTTAIARPCRGVTCFGDAVCKTGTDMHPGTCVCPWGFVGTDCSEKEDCKIGSIPSSIKCGTASCFLDFQVTGSIRMPSIVERSSGRLYHTVKQDGSTYTFAIDINHQNTKKVCLNISTNGHKSECNMSTCIAVEYTDTQLIGAPLLNCTTKDGHPGDCDIVLFTNLPLPNGECPQLFVHPDTSLERVHIFENVLINSTGAMAHCVAPVSAHTPNGSNQKLCITDSAQRVMCLNTTVTQPGCKASNGATDQAKQLVKTGMVSCVCQLENMEPINIIKRNPRPSAKALTKVAGFGAGGMAGAMAAGVVIYLVIKKIKAKPSTVDCIIEKRPPAEKPKSVVAPTQPEVPISLKRRQVRPEMAWEKGF